MDVTWWPGERGVSRAWLVAELENLPAQRGAAVRVLELVDDPRSSARDLASAAGADPALTARLLRLANSAYYGLSGRVGNPGFAVTVVGFSTVRALAVVSAADLGGSPEDVPPGFWGWASATAVASGLLAPRVGAEAPDAFCLGLLHDLGAALLHRHDRDGFAAAHLTGTPADAAVRERSTFGLSHADAGAVALATWRFPRAMTDAVREHHAPLGRERTPEQRALRGGMALAELALGLVDPGDPDWVLALATCHLDPDVAVGLAERVRERAAEVESAVVTW